MSLDLTGLAPCAPERPNSALRFIDVAVTATANEFAGIYRGKQVHVADFPNTLERARAAGVEKVILTGMSLPDIVINSQIAKSQPPGSCYYTIGVHPYHATELSGQGEEPQSKYLTEMAQSIEDAMTQEPPLIAAYGELGLDYDRLVHADKETQIAAFKAQLDLFLEKGWQLPLFLHCRASFGDFFDIMKSYAGKLPRGGLMHSFVGSRSQMQALVDLGLGISVNGFSFKDRESLDMVAAIPLDKLQIETDAPWGEIKPTSEIAKQYLVNAPPLPLSKKKDKWDAACMVKERNESCAIDRVAYVVAGLKGITVEEVAKAAWENSIKMFKLGRV